MLISLCVFLAAFIVVMVFYDHVIAFIITQFAAIESSNGNNLFTNTIAEGFLVQLQASAIVGVILSLPVHVINVLQFVFPGISRKAQRHIVWGLVASLALAVFGFSLAYKRIIPFSVRFLTDTAFIPDGVGMLLSFKQSITYVLSFLLWTIITFQSPIVLEILLAMNILNRKAVFRATRFVIVGIFILSAIITPSVDPLSQCAIAFPLILLFFIVILVAKVFRLGEG